MLNSQQMVMSWQALLRSNLMQPIKKQLCTLHFIASDSAAAPASSFWHNQFRGIKCVPHAPGTVSQSLAPVAQLAAACTCSGAWKSNQVRGHSTHSAPKQVKHKIVFMGTPEYSALVMRDLCNAARQQTSTFEVVAVVSRRLPHPPHHSIAHGKSHTPAHTPASMSCTLASTGQPVATRPWCPEGSTSAHVAGSIQHLKRLVHSSSSPSRGHTQGVVWDVPWLFCTWNAPAGGSLRSSVNRCLAGHCLVSTVSSNLVPAQHAVAQVASYPVLQAALHTAAQQQGQPPPSLHWTPHIPKTPVIAEALRQGLAHTQVLCPINAKQEDFLHHMESEVRPDLVVTAAYGCILPQRFLDIPRLGTINIHPSLLPKYRGAAPVQRCLQDGCAKTGVSLACTVLKCDAGPVLAKQEVQVLPDEQAPELTTRLFALGSHMLLQHLPLVLSGQASSVAVPQDDSEATYAPKLSRDESFLDFSRTAQQLHNQVRALAGWPGTRATFVLHDKATGQQTSLHLKVLRTRVITHAAQLSQPEPTSSDVQRHTQSSKFAPQSTAYQQQAEHSCDEPGGVHLPGLAYELPTGQASNVQGQLVVPCAGGTFLQLCQVRYLDSHRQNVHKATGLSGSELLAGLGKQAVLLLQLA